MEPDRAVAPARRVTLPGMEEAGAYEWFQRGMELMRTRDFHPAAVALERAKAIEPDKGSIREALGRAYLSTRQFERAAVEFGVAVEIQPTDHYAHYCLGRALQGLGEADRAARHYELARCLGSTLV